MKSAPAIAFDYVPSRWLAAAIVAVALLALVAVAFTGVAAWARLALAGGVVVPVAPRSALCYFAQVKPCLDGAGQNFVDRRILQELADGGVRDAGFGGVHDGLVRECVNGIKRVHF